MAKQKRRGHGEGSIYYREGEKRWVASFVLENGKRKYLTGKTQKEALEKLRKAQREYEQGMLATGTRQTVKQYLEYWLEDVHKSRIRLSTYVEYRLMLDKHILPALGQMQLQRLTSEQVEALYARKREEGLSPGSIRNIHTVLHKALEHAVRRSCVARNVCDSVELPRYSRGEARILTKEQAKLLLEQARGHQMEAILTLAVTTGMRRGELLGLHWQDIDFERGSLQVRRTMNRISGHGLRETEPKTAQSRRNIVLPQFVVEVLKEHRARQREECLQAGDAWKDHDLVFSTRRGGFLDP